MYTFLAKITKSFSYLLRVIQVLGLVYLLLYAIYWVCALAHFSLEGLLSPLYAAPQLMTENVLNTFNVSISNEYNLLHLDILLSIFLVFIILLLSNFIFIFTGAIERFFVDKSYQKGEQDRKKY